VNFPYCLMRWSVHEFFEYLAEPEFNSVHGSITLSFIDKRVAWRLTDTVWLGGELWSVLDRGGESATRSWDSHPVASHCISDTCWVWHVQSGSKNYTTKLHKNLYNFVKDFSIFKIISRSPSAVNIGNRFYNKAVINDATKPQTFCCITLWNIQQNWHCVLTAHFQKRILHCIIFHNTI